MILIRSSASFNDTDFIDKSMIFSRFLKQGLALEFLFISSCLSISDTAKFTSFLSNENRLDISTIVNMGE